MENNVYAPPKANLVGETSEVQELASRWRRLWASVVDGIIMVVIVLPLMYVTGGFDQIAEGQSTNVNYNFLDGMIGVQGGSGGMYNLLVGLAGTIIFLLINGKMLLDYGQTIGKKVLGIKIVDLDGNLPTLKQHFIKRYLVYIIPGQIPVIGGVVSIINLLLIFRKDKRCGHDLVAGTQVVRC